MPRLPGALLITFLCTASCTAAPPAAGLRVVASFYTLAHFAEQVGGDRIRVVSVAPTGAQPHGWEPSPRAVKEAVSADIFLYQGAGLDPWAEDVAPDVASRGGVVVEMTKHFDLLGDNDVPGHPAHVHGPGPGDPHIWLDPLLAVKEVEIIAAAFGRRDPGNASYYQRNADSYVTRLRALHERFVQGLKDCAVNEIIVTHDAFSYLGRRYGVTVHGIAGVSPEKEPSPRRLQALVRRARDRDLRNIFVEPSVSPRLAETLAREAGLSVLMLDPVASGADPRTGGRGTYINRMEHNLEQLKTGLQCGRR